MNLLPAPAIDWTQGKLAVFAQHYEQLCQQGSTATFDYQLPYPKYEFFCYLVERQQVLLHGSNNPGITLFEPRPQTDYMGRAITAVFATPDGIWPIFFAIIDRENYQGSLRNACIWKTDEQGQRRKMYFFSINANQLENHPWRQGTIYVLPRSTFEAVRDFNGQPLEEWASPSEVRPLGKVLVSPEDFPFLNSVEGHTDRVNDLIVILLTSFEQKQELDDGYGFRYVWDAGREAQMNELLELLVEAAPDVQGEVSREPGEGLLWLRLRGGAGVKETIAALLERIRGG